MSRTHRSYNNTPHEHHGPKTNRFLAAQNREHSHQRLGSKRDPDVMCEEDEPRGLQFRHGSPKQSERRPH